MVVYISVFFFVCLIFILFSVCLLNYILFEELSGNWERLIEYYFNLGLSYVEILCFIVVVYGIYGIYICLR